VIRGKIARIKSIEKGCYMEKHRFFALIAMASLLILFAFAVVEGGTPANSDA
jgi:hypothetical protein